MPQAAATFVPDSPLVAAVLASPRHEDRRGRGRPDMIVLHYTGLPTLDDALGHLVGPDGNVSCHYLVDQNGRAIQLVPEARRAWHAGLSFWAGDTDINSRSVGIEIVNPGHDLGYPAFADAQIEAVVALCRDIGMRHPVRPEHVLAHSDVAPTRKRDPGEKFPWPTLADHGVGLWVPPAPLRDGRHLALGDSGPPVEAVQALLALYGYDCAVTGHVDTKTAAAVAAFQRHFRPARVDGLADASTITTLRDLIAARDDLV